MAHFTFTFLYLKRRCYCKNSLAISLCGHTADAGLSGCTANMS